MNPITAQYDAASVPSFGRGNPLCEALPPLPVESEFVEALVKRPRGDFSHSNTGAVSSFCEISSLLDINVPRPESRIIAVRIFSMLHNTYSKMAPFSPEFVRTVNDIDNYLFEQNERIEFQSDAMTLMAWSGMGKTTLIKSISALFPRVIEHTSYHGRPFFQKQVVWLSVDAPLNGSPKGFLLNIAQSLDIALGLHGPARYHDQMIRLSAESMKVRIARALRSHCVGLLHVDDVQRWGEADSKTRSMSVAMLVGLSNTIGCALLLSGTLAALAVLQSNFESSRRANRRSAVMLQSAQDGEDPFFSGLVNFLFKYQLTVPAVAPTPELRQALLYLTAGVPGVLTSLFVATQETALLLGCPLSAELFREVMQNDFGILSDSVKELRSLCSKGKNQWDAALDKQIADFLKKVNKES